MAIRCKYCGGPVNELGQCIEIPEDLARLARGQFTEADYHYLKSEQALSLLIIDLGDSCIVRIEKGGAWVSEFPSLDTWWQMGYGAVGLICKHFDHLRTAIDAIEGEKPLPRIERTGGGCVLTHRLILGDDPEHQHLLMPEEYKSLSELAGHPLPVFTPQAGTWRQIIATTDDEGTPFDVWRYTK